MESGARCADALLFIMRPSEKKNFFVSKKKVAKGNSRELTIKKADYTVNSLMDKVFSVLSFFLFISILFYIACVFCAGSWKTAQEHRRNNKKTADHAWQAGSAAGVPARIRVVRQDRVAPNREPASQRADPHPLLPREPLRARADRGARRLACPPPFLRVDLSFPPSSCTSLGILRAVGGAPAPPPKLHFPA